MDKKFECFVNYLLENDKETIEIINATPHPIVLKTSSKEITYPKSDILARVETKSKKVDDIEVEVYENVYGDVQGLPKEKNGVYYIVSAMVLSANKESNNKRTDLIAPDTSPNGGAIRDGGQIKAVTRFVV